MLALLFPGQGAQRPAMGAPWLDHPSWAMVDRLSDVVSRDLGHLLIEAGPEELRATRNAQLATYALSLVVLDAALSGPLGAAKPALAAVAGHSLGEYTALTAAGVVTPEVGAQLVQARGEAMQAAAESNPGTMTAVLGLELTEVADACSAVQEAWVANDNTPGQVVVAGSHSGVERAAQEAQRRGAKRVVPLQVGGAFHTPLMVSAQAPLDEALGLAVFSRARTPVVANVDAAPHGDGFRALLSSQLCSRVRWRESLEVLASLGASVFIELGPGTEMSGMVKRTVPAATRANIAGPEDLEPLTALLAPAPTAN